MKYTRMIITSVSRTRSLNGPLRLMFLATLLVTFFDASADAEGDQAADLPRIQVVMLTPADVEPPAGHEQRLTQLAIYTEAFFDHWMNRWKYPPVRKRIFDRNPDGSLVIRYVRGQHPAASGAYDRPPVMDEVYNTAIPKYKIPRHLHVWWVHVYLGPDRGFKDWNGIGTALHGGNASIRYTSDPGTIDPRLPILAGFHESYGLKAVIHELGHAFGLPHMGPRRSDRAGNTLMGPNSIEWNRTVNQREPRGYLSEASAAMLWKHPIFSGSTKDRAVVPEVEVTGLQFKVIRRSGKIRISGHVKSNIQPHSVVVVDESQAALSEYWRKSYVGRVAADGGFSVDVTEPAPADGALKIVFCFENGLYTGDGKTLNLSGAISKEYHYQNRSIDFAE